MTATKTTFIVREMQNVNSIRQGEKVVTTSLVSAKRIASSNQVYQGTVLIIESEDGEPLAQKVEGKWENLNKWGTPSAGDHVSQKANQHV